MPARSVRCGTMPMPRGGSAPALNWCLILDSNDPTLYDVRSKAPGPQGSLPITPDKVLMALASANKGNSSKAI